MYNILQQTYPPFVSLQPYQTFHKQIFSIFLLFSFPHSSLSFLLCKLLEIFFDGIFAELKIKWKLRSLCCDFVSVGIWISLKVDFFVELKIEKSMMLWTEKWNIFWIIELWTNGIESDGLCQYFLVFRVFYPFKLFFVSTSAVVSQENHTNSAPKCKAFEL